MRTKQEIFEIIKDVESTRNHAATTKVATVMAVELLLDLRELLQTNDMDLAKVFKLDK